MKSWLYIVPAILVILGCKSIDNNSVMLDLGTFKIAIPKEWKYIKQQGEDSFVGEIQITKTTFLNFDCSEHGYANNLISSQDEYLTKQEWYNGQVGFLQTDSKIIVHKPNSADKVKFPKADFVADITNEGKTNSIAIEIPAEINAHHIKIDSTDKYIFKTIWPKTPGKGMTGIYFHNRTSHFNFQMSGRNLSAKDQQLALQAFKTITFKNK